MNLIILVINLYIQYLNRCCLPSLLPLVGEAFCYIHVIQLKLLHGFVAICTLHINILLVMETAVHMSLMEH